MIVNMKNESGMALVLVLMVVALITAVVVEFSYEVYVSTSSLHNWQAAQRLSFAARSAARLASKAISEASAGKSYTYPGFMELTYENPIEKAAGVVVIRAEDENSKFNLNQLAFKGTGRLNEAGYQAFRRLLRALELDPAISDRLADWIDADSEPLSGNSEAGAKNAPLDSLDELYLTGIDAESIRKLLPYVTIWGRTQIDGSGIININGAEVPVLMSLSDSIDRQLAERIVRYRENSHFETKQDILKVAGFESLSAPPSMASIDVKGTVFRVSATANSAEIKRTVECVIEVPSMSVKYWREL